MSDLKPCPFCGAIPSPERIISSTPAETYWCWVLCCANPACPMTYVGVEGATEDECAPKWNTRALAPAQPASDRDWTNWANDDNGNYQNRCIVCKQTFTGPKRFVMCRGCTTRYARNGSTPEDTK